LFGDELPGMLHKVAKHLERLGAQVDLPIAGAQTSAHQVQRKAVKLQNPMKEMVHFVSCEAIILRRNFYERIASALITLMLDPIETDRLSGFRHPSTGITAGPSDICFGGAAPGGANDLTIESLLAHVTDLTYHGWGYGPLRPAQPPLQAFLRNGHLERL
jgi:hypothetical protein